MARLTRNTAARAASAFYKGFDFDARFRIDGEAGTLRIVHDDDGDAGLGTVQARVRELLEGADPQEAFEVTRTAEALEIRRASAGPASMATPEPQLPPEPIEADLQEDPVENVPR